jgi:hypothetical protein
VVQILSLQYPGSKYIQAVEIQSATVYSTQLASLEAPVLYAMPWWLDAVCGERGWQALIQYDGQQSAAAMMPFHPTRIRGLSAMITPPLTQWLPITRLKPDAVVSIDRLLSTLPKTQILDLTLQGADDGHFGQHGSVRYSYVLPAAPFIDLVRSRYNEGLRRNLRAANDTYHIDVSADIGLLLDLYKASHLQQGIAPPKWADNILRTVFDQLVLHQSGQLTMVYHHQKPIAGVLIGWDRHNSYYLAGGKTGGEQAASAHALLLDKAIEEAMANGRAFDFEGSMHPGIANFFQSFGASPRPYWHIRKFRGLGKLWSMFHK